VRPAAMSRSTFSSRSVSAYGTGASGCRGDGGEFGEGDAGELREPVDMGLQRGVAVGGGRCGPQRAYSTRTAARGQIPPRPCVTRHSLPRAGTPGAPTPWRQRPSWSGHFPRPGGRSDRTPRAPRRGRHAVGDVARIARGLSGGAMTRFHECQRRSSDPITLIGWARLSHGSSGARGCVPAVPACVRAAPAVEDLRWSVSCTTAMRAGSSPTTRVVWPFPQVSSSRTTLPGP
jgi:hypothetical protein